jgi:N-acetylglucosaminyldiphosphoundecaprenol N-acetyl-beta-D-mannosaminyltransferase
MMGCQIDNLSMEESLTTIESFIRSQAASTCRDQCDKVVKASRDPELRRIINQCA